MTTKINSALNEAKEIINALMNSEEIFYDVSVPYRGATFLNTIPATPCPVWDEQGDCGGKVILLKCSRFGK